MRLWLIAALSISTFAAKPPGDYCGSHPGRPRQEIFLHRQNVRSKLKAATAQTNQDSGQIAIIDDSGGVIGRRNPFTIDGKTLVFTPGTAGYTVQTRAGSFDANATGSKIPDFADDDSRAFALP